MQRKLTITVADEVYRGLHEKIGRGHISEFIEDLVRLNGLLHKAMADQIRTIAKERLATYAGGLSQVDLRAVERAIKLQLALP
jgi:predicted CopG family antitoxin